MKDVQNKVISKGGSITIPAQVRRRFNEFQSGNAVVMEIQGDSIVITPRLPHCLFCDSTDNLNRFRGRIVCKDCAAAVMKEAEPNGQ